MSLVVVGLSMGKKEDEWDGETPLMHPRQFWYQSPGSASSYPTAMRAASSFPNVLFLPPQGGERAFFPNDTMRAVLAETS